MKLQDRERVDGTSVTIGRRVYYRNRKQKTSRCYAAEYRDLDGKQVCRNLRTKSRGEARRKAIEIQQELEQGVEQARGVNMTVEELIDRYTRAYLVRGLAPKTEKKYAADLNKLKMYCAHANIKLARQLTEYQLCRYRKWLGKYEYADKTVEGAVVLAKQVFKWAWRQRLLLDYRFSGTSFPKARAKPQPCFTTEQVDALIKAADGEEKLAFALIGYAGLRIGEVEQLAWDDLEMIGDGFTMIHVRRGGSRGTPKDRDDRFVPVHRVVASLLGERARKVGRVFRDATERKLLKRVKELCGECGFENPRRYKLHSFRHHFASLCANHHVAYRKALTWLGHSSSDMLELYYHLHDEESQQAMRALANSGLTQGSFRGINSPSEGTLRAMGQSKIEKTLQVPEMQGLVECLSGITERAGFEPAVG